MYDILKSIEAQKKYCEEKRLHTSHRNRDVAGIAIRISILLVVPCGEESLMKENQRAFL